MTDVPQHLIETVNRLVRARLPFPFGGSIPATAVKP